MHWQHFNRVRHMLQSKGKNAWHNPYSRKISFPEIASFMTEREWTFFASPTLRRLVRRLATWYLCRNDRVHVSSILKPMEFAEMLELMVHVVDPVFESWSCVWCIDNSTKINVDNNTTNSSIKKFPKTILALPLLERLISFDKHFVFKNQICVH